MLDSGQNEALQPGRPKADNTELVVELLLAQFRLGGDLAQTFDRAVRKVGSPARATRMQVSIKSLRERLREAHRNANFMRIYPLAIERAERDGIAVPSEVHSELELLRRNHEESIAYLEQNPEILRAYQTQMHAYTALKEYNRRLALFYKSIDDLVGPDTRISVLKRAYNAARLVSQQTGKNG